MSATPVVPFGTQRVNAGKAERFAPISATVPTVEGEVYASAKDGEPTLVHKIGRQSESITMHAVASALTSGKIVPPDVLALAFTVEDGKTRKLSAVGAKLAAELAKYA